ncbi:pyridoxal-phosphate-dependent aminotransferase family protein [Palleronia abyssalis]|uniref:Soluble hydrogenase 42 kDa subunit n=1 Tax=Palleronia abyssalis TaxID=1501240 RepID=A0A2R8BUG7_9RHOB|nr:aminotransferase class V-fold PLP-dependent enzyme [Palleronia abyssalis]SPJ23790.1 Soluble hydrogenase 42 kDa subunit [Palleronia abyssalis]
MSLSHGRPYLAIPGPSVMPEEVLRAMHRSAPNIYEGQIVDMTATIVADLRRVARTKGDVAIYISNGHGLWEASLANVLAPGDAVLVPVTGRFGHGWAAQAGRMGAEVRLVDFGKQQAIDPARVAEALKADTEHRIKAVLAVHVDTSTGIRNDVAALRRALDETGHPALLMMDAIASLGCDRIEMDAWGVDVLLAASQKGLMTPPGIGFLWVSEKAQAVRDGIEVTSPYWDWAPRLHPEGYYQHFCGTAPTHHLYGLRAALDMILTEGLENVWNRHEVLARAIWAAAQRWGADGPLTVNAPEGVRSHAVTALRLGGDMADRLRTWTDTCGGVTLGIGLGMAEPGDVDFGGFFRIGHMGHVNAHMVLGALSVIEAGMTACEIPHGDGAVAEAARICAGA